MSFQLTNPGSSQKPYWMETVFCSQEEQFLGIEIGAPDINLTKENDIATLLQPSLF